MAALPPDAVVGLVGAGTMGAGIAEVAAAAGHPVRLYDAVPDAAAAAYARIAATLERRVAKGRLSAQDAAAIRTRIAVAGDIAELAPARLIIEAVPEDPTLKRTVLAACEAVCPADTILASNTSSLSIAALATALKRRARFLGLHFFNPAPVMRLVEVARGPDTDPAVAETAFDTVAAWGKVAVPVRATPGFIVNRVARPFYGEALILLQDGGGDPTMAATIDAVLCEAGGFAMGPFALMDVIGLDVNLAVSEAIYAASGFDPRYRPSPLQRDLVAAGRLGRKSGRGFFDYGRDSPVPAPATAPPAPPPEAVIVEGDLGPANPLVELARAAGLAVTHRDGAGREGEGRLVIDDVILAPSDGRSATERMAAEGGPHAVFDLCGDYARAPRIAVAVANQADPAARHRVAGFFQALGKRVTLLDDIPGLIVVRTVAMLANEAAEMVQQGVATPAAVDTAMRLGVNYPRGPLAWAEEIGLARVVAVLDHLGRTGGERYRASILLRRKALTGARLMAEGGHGQ